jgi:tRNA pseudouridine55 synthase
VTRPAASRLPSSGGVLPVDKPEGPTSHDVVARVRRTLGERRIGHTGTLDPFASGLLVLCLGPATRLSEYLTGMDKRYEAVVRLGQRTLTHDTESPVLEEDDAWRGLDRARVEHALGPLRGTIRQRPPAFSAKKVGGEPAHRKARRGETVDLAEVEVEVSALELLDLELPLARLCVVCSSGTYVRALARDLGEALGVGAHLVELRRTRVGRFRVEDAAQPGSLEDADALLAKLLDPAAAVAHLPSVSIARPDAVRMAQGQTVAAPGFEADGPVAVLAEGTLVAVATAGDGRLRPRKVFGSEAGG